MSSIYVETTEGPRPLRTTGFSLIGKPDFTEGFDLAQHDLRLIPTDW